MVGAPTNNTSTISISLLPNFPPPAPDPWQLRVQRQSGVAGPACHAPLLASPLPSPSFCPLLLSQRLCLSACRKAVSPTPPRRVDTALKQRRCSQRRARSAPAGAGWGSRLLRRRRQQGGVSGDHRGACGAQQREEARTSNDAQDPHGPSPLSFPPFPYPFFQEARRHLPPIALCNHPPPRRGHIAFRLRVLHLSVGNTDEFFLSMGPNYYCCYRIGACHQACVRVRVKEGGSICSYLYPSRSDQTTAGSQRNKHEERSKGRESVFLCTKRGRERDSMAGRRMVRSRAAVTPSRPPPRAAAGSPSPRRGCRRRCARAACRRPATGRRARPPRSAWSAARTCRRS